MIYAEIDRQTPFLHRNIKAMFGHHCTSVVVFLVIVMGWRSGIGADEQTRTTIKQCEQCEDKLNQNQKEMSLQQREINLLRSEMKQLENKYNSEMEAVRALQIKLNDLEESMTKKSLISGVSYIRWGEIYLSEIRFAGLYR